MTNILVLAADETHDDLDDGYPVCLTEIAGKPLLQHLISRCQDLIDPHFILAVQEKDCKRWHLDNVVRQLSMNAQVVQVRNPTAGAACTAMLAIDSIDNKDQLIILNGNEFVDIDFAAPARSFSQAGLDGGVVSFDSVHPRYSYVRMNGDRVVEVAEKNPISRNATVGFYWFRKGSDFVRAAQRSIIKGAHVGGVFYICPTFNEMILERAQIGIHKIDTRLFHPIKSERQIERFEGSIQQVRDWDANRTS